MRWVAAALARGGMVDPVTGGNSLAGRLGAQGAVPAFLGPDLLSRPAVIGLGGLLHQRWPALRASVTSLWLSGGGALLLAGVASFGAAVVVGPRWPCWVCRHLVQQDTFVALWWC